MLTTTHVNKDYNFYVSMENELVSMFHEAKNRLAFLSCCEKSLCQHQSMGNGQNLCCDLCFQRVVFNVRSFIGATKWKYWHISCNWLNVAIGTKFNKFFSDTIMAMWWVNNSPATLNITFDEFAFSPRYQKFLSPRIFTLRFGIWLSRQKIWWLYPYSRL